jgi:hypothetical protein
MSVFQLSDKNLAFAPSRVQGQANQSRVAIPGISLVAGFQGKQFVHSITLLEQTTSQEPTFLNSTLKFDVKSV